MDRETRRRDTARGKLVVGATALLLVLAGWSAPAATASGLDLGEAPGMEAGPVITAAGTVWAGSEGISLRRAGGRTTALAPPGAPSFQGFVDQAWFGGRWWVLATTRGLLAGIVGGPMRPLPRVLQGCNPGSTRYTIPPLLAVSGARLFALLAPVCRRRHPASFGTLISVDLATNRWRVLALAPGEPDALAAAGPYVALAYSRPRREGTTNGDGKPSTAVRIWSAGSGHAVATIAAPAGTPAGIGSLQLDARGHVLASRECCAANGPLATVAMPPRIEYFWLGSPGTKRAVRVSLGPDASLSDGRIAYVGSREGPGSAIDVLTLATGRRHTVTTFSGTAGVSGVALAGDELAWGQRSSAIVATQGGCGTVFLSPPQVATVNLRVLPSEPFAETGPPVPGGGRECPVP
jgi:hypothetical protein